MQSQAVAEDNSVARSAYLPYRSLTWWILALPVLLGVALATHRLYLLLLSHVMAGGLWTGADIFLGFVLGPVWGHLEPAQRRAVQMQLIPKTLLYMPILGLTTGTAGWFLAHWDGYATIHSALFPWVVAAGCVALVLTVVGLGVMLPTNLRMLREMSGPAPDHETIRRLTFRLRRLAGVQGLFQVGIMIIMAYLTLAP